MSRIMLCGSSNADEIKMLVDEGVDAIGLITEVGQQIPCRLSLEHARYLCGLIPPMVAGVLILTEERVEEVCRMAEFIAPAAVQLHGFNTAEDVAVLRGRLKSRIIKTLHFQDGQLAGDGSPEEVALEYLRAGADAILLDTCAPGKYGSTGKTLPWDTASRIRNAVLPAPLILAGGLHPHNVAVAVKEVQPYAVDAFSSVTSGGKLDRSKVRAFVGAVRQCRTSDAYLELPCGKRGLI